jgi:hypothetical protein
VLLQLHPCEEEEATTMWRDLRSAGQHPPRDDAPRKPPTVRTGSAHLRAAGVVFGRTVAVLLWRDMEVLGEKQLKDKLEDLTGIHSSRLMIFLQDGTLYDDKNPSVRTEDMGGTVRPEP